jgi:lipopolysaccharide/colanic/teichoic acid biosynthesis glycosyltransferase
MTTTHVAPPANLNRSGLQVEGSEYLFPSPWCTSLGKRIFDAVLATIFLILALPVMLVASVAVLATPGPLFFASRRVGQGGRQIRVLKFRTMFPRKDLGVQLTRTSDNRVTKVGRFLRAWKIDELPQFINVIRGDMSLVGPRPDSAEFLNALPPSVQLVLFSIRPGISSIASVVFRNEEELLSRVPEKDLTGYYVTTLLPEKVGLDLEYARQATMFTDIRLLLRTLLAVLR